MGNFFDFFWLEAVEVAFVAPGRLQFFIPDFCQLLQSPFSIGQHLFAYRVQLNPYILHFGGLRLVCTQQYARGEATRCF